MGGDHNVPIRLRSWFLVLVQFGILLYLALTGPLIALPVGWLLLEMAAIALGVWALAVMRLEQMSVLPEVRGNGELVAHGPYRWIRHPMYTAVLLGALALTAATPTPERIAAWFILLVDLVVKLRFEEGLLAAAYPGYPAYRQRTKALLPWIW